jgi:hypothetical protein
MKILDFWKEEINGKQIEVLKIPHDKYGNPRYFIPLDCLDEDLEKALKKAKSIGGKKICREMLQSGRGY